MSIAEVLHILLRSAAVFIPVLLVALGLSLLATRGTTPDRLRRGRRWLLGAASVAVATAATAQLWVRTGTHGRLLTTLAVPFATYLVVLLLVAWLNRRVHDDPTRLKVRKGLIYLGVLVVAATLVHVWVIRQQVNYTMVLSVVGAGLALALHQVLLSVTGWVLLLIQRHYDVGHRVQIGDLKGDVSDIGIFHTTLVEIGNWVDADQSTGRLVTVPNSFVFTQPIYNYTRGFEYIWHEIRVLVTFESHWRKAQQILLDAAQEGVEPIADKFRTQIRHMARKYMILYEHITPIVYPRILDSGVELTLRYLTEPKRRRSTEAELTGKILDAFAEQPDIDFAYPTTRFYDASREGKATPPPSPPPSDAPQPT